MCCNSAAFVIDANVATDAIAATAVAVVDMQKKDTKACECDVVVIVAAAVDHNNAL